MKKVNYKTELFDLLKDLTSINTQIILDKENNKIVVKRADSESTIAYELKTSKDYFDFEEEQIAFYNYPEFYQFFKAFIEPELSIDQKNLVLKEGSSKTNYILSNPEAIPPGPKSINFKDPDIRINLSSEELDELLKMINLINSKKVQIYGDGKKITFKIFNNLHDNTFEKAFEVENISNFESEIDFVMFSDTFKNLPIKRNYVIEIKSQGFVKISLVNEEISLHIYTGRVKN
jgi:hypothetical protein